ncbi:hypothetical protein THRCLA_11181 [Thraustotheca clavata]|uniref:Secreted protein n=1 Tax=Thraustotheca clavata TaxID=74557 RepID=A0A1V9Y8N5_9STRA|nr:hypothetical protein THRCLA_11181 [Thraustotheca clavata]
MANTIQWLFIYCVIVASQGPPNNGERTCSVTLGGPVSQTSTAGTMSFCTAFPQERCCLPVHDEYVKSTFYALLDSGYICASATNTAIAHLQTMFCLACDPSMSLYLTPPRNTTFFSAPQTLKVCRALADAVSPYYFSDCGLTYAGDRNNLCIPKTAISPNMVFPGCSEGQNICYSTTQGYYSPIWYCSSSPCGPDTPFGLNDIPCSGPTCTPAFQFLNDNRAAKPPFFEPFAVEIIDESTCAPGESSCCMTDSSIVPTS